MKSQTRFHRNRFLYCIAVLATIGLGLASRSFPFIFPSILGKYPGDALWALMMFFALGIPFQKSSTGQLFVITLFICIIVECLKLYQAAWAVNIRHSTLGHLVFGHTFSWQNLLAYAIGALAGVTFESGYNFLRRRPPVASST